MCGGSGGGKGGGGGSSLPQDLSTMTPQQYKDSVEYLATTKTPAELRRNNEIVESQLYDVASKRYGAKSPSEKAKLDKAYTNLRIMNSYHVDAMELGKKIKAGKSPSLKTFERRFKTARGDFAD